MIIVCLYFLLFLFVVKLLYQIPLRDSFAFWLFSKKGKTNNAKSQKISKMSQLIQKFFFFCAHTISLIRKNGLRPKVYPLRVDTERRRNESLAEASASLLKSRETKEKEIETKTEEISRMSWTIPLISLACMSPWIARMSVLLSEDILRVLISRVAALMRASRIAIASATRGEST